MTSERKKRRRQEKLDKAISDGKMTLAKEHIEVSSIEKKSEEIPVDVEEEPETVEILPTHQIITFLNNDVESIIEYCARMNLDVVIRKSR
jgi:hypothetical protein